MRFYQSGTTYYVHDSAGAGQLLGEYYNGNIAGRYVPGAGVDEPAAGVSKTGARSWYHADERGSVIAGSNNSGVNERIVTYDENGKRGGNLSYRFAFTGQVHLINDVYDYKTRNYNARLPRFLQTDTIGYGGGMNLYVYGGGDPVNFTDPLGLKRQKPNIPPKHDSGGGGGGGQTVTITGDRADRALRDTLIILNRIATHEFLHSSAMGSNGETLTEDIVVTGHRPGRPSLPGNLPPPVPAVLSSWSLPSSVYLASEAQQPRECYTINGVQICNRPDTREDRCEGGKQMQEMAKAMGFGLGGTAGVRTGLGRAGTTVVGRAIGWGVAVAAALAATGYAMEAANCDD